MDSVNEVVIRPKRGRLGQSWAIMGYIFQIIRDIDPKLRIMIDTFTLLGFIWSASTIFKLIGLFLHGFRVHVWSRIWTLDLKKKYGEWVMITGATDGVGLEYAREFAKRDHSLILLGRNEAKLGRVKAELSAHISPSRIVTVVLDLDTAEPQDYRRVAEEIGANGREIGILVNNAGVMYDSPNRFMDQPEDKIWQQVRVNILGLLMITRCVLPHMIRRKRGLIINMSSIAGYKPLPLMGVYSASKVFVEWFSKTLEYEYKGQGIDVQTLIPSYISTKMTSWGSVMKNPSIHVPDANAFARNAIATIGRSWHTTGYWTHGIQHFFYEWFTPSWLYNLSSWYVLQSIDSTKGKGKGKGKAA